MKENARISMLRRKQSSLSCDHFTENNTEHSKPAYKTPPSLGKAAMKEWRALPHFIHKKHHVILPMAEKVRATIEAT